MTRKRFVASLLSLCLLLALAASTHAGEKITMIPGSWSGNTIDFLRMQLERWEKETGNTVEILKVPNNTSEVLAISQQNLAAQTADVDIYPMDIVWPGMLGRYFVDLKEYLPAEEIAKYNPVTIATDTVDGRLVGIPFYADTSIFYYRKDLLEKYGYSTPPATWAEVKEMCEKVQAGERAAGNANFWGFVFPGAATDAFANDILEWTAGNDGGDWVDKNGNVTINNPNAREILEFITGWYGKIVPEGVTSYNNDEARGFFQSGNALFMRNWPFAYALGQSADSPIKDKFHITAIPHGPKGKSHSSMGGWQLGISKFSKNPKLAAEVIKFINRPDNQKERMLKLARTATHMELLKDPEIVAAYPWIATVESLDLVVRPAANTGTKYNQVSSAVTKAIQDMMTGRATVADRLVQLETELNRIKGRGW